MVHFSWNTFHCSYLWHAICDICRQQHSRAVVTGHIILLLRMLRHVLLSFLPSFFLYTHGSEPIDHVGQAMLWTYYLKQFANANIECSFASYCISICWKDPTMTDTHLQLTVCVMSPIWVEFTAIQHLQQALKIPPQHFYTSNTSSPHPATPSSITTPYFLHSFTIPPDFHNISTTLLLPPRRTSTTPPSSDARHNYIHERNQSSVNCWHTSLCLTLRPQILTHPSYSSLSPTYTDNRHI